MPKETGEILRETKENVRGIEGNATNGEFLAI